tara:strand:- start:423 stop:686 length:264 start_codon:yes stop_codon:yes gene_type:complete
VHYFGAIGISRPNLIQNNQLAAAGVTTLSHYEPLHLSPAGRHFGRIAGELKITENASTRLLRLPIWPDMQYSEADYVVDLLFSALAN